MNLRDQISNDEKIIWEGDKAKAVSVLEAIFNPMLIFAIIWGAFDLSILAASSVGGMDDTTASFIVPFILLHMAPVWLYLGGCICAGLKAKHTHYLFTNKNIYVQSGIFSVTTSVKPITDIAHVTVHQGLFDRICGTGDIECECNHYEYSGSTHAGGGVHIGNIEDYEYVFKLLKKVQDNINQAKQGGIL